MSYSDDFYAESGDSFYYNTSFELPLAEYLTLGAHAGYQTIDDNEALYSGEQLHSRHRSRLFMSVGGRIPG